MRSQDRPTQSNPFRCAARAAVAVLALALVTTVVVSPASAAPAQEEPAGGIGLRLLDAPVSAKDDPRARVYIVDHLAPGTEIERRIEVTNTTGSAQEVVLYPSAATIDEGTFVGSAGKAVNELASWTSVTPGTTSVPAGEAQTALVKITVPDDAAPGEQYGVVWAEARSDSADGGGVVQVSRVGIRLYVSVGPGGAPAADFQIDAMTAERTDDGAPVVTASVQNSGGRALDMKGTLELTNGPGGLAAGPFPAELGSTLAIGDTGSVRVTLDERLPDGPWEAVITLESGLTERSASATITFPVSGAAPPVAVATDSTGTPRLLVGGVAAALTLLAGAAWSVRRRGGTPRPQSEVVAPQPDRASV